MKNKQCRLYLYFFLMMIMSIPFAYYRRGAFEFIFTKYIVVVLFFFLFYKLVDNIKKISNILWILCIGSSLYSLFAMYGGKFESGRLTFGHMFDPNDLAFFALSILPFNILFISQNTLFMKRLTSLFNIAFGIIFILMTGSRGGFIALGVVVLMLLFTKSEAIKNSYRIIIISVSLIAAVYGGAKIDYTRFRTITNISEDYNVFDETGRIEIWKKGIELMLSNPLTGVGVSCFEQAIGEKRSEIGLQEIWQSPHNAIIQIGTETGIIGVIFYLLISYGALKIFNNAKYLKNDEKKLKIGQIAKMGFVGQLVAAMFLSQAYSIYWAFYIAISATFLNLLKQPMLTKDKAILN